MPDPIHGVNATQPLDVTSTGQTGPGSTAVAAAASNQPSPGTLDSADVARAEALLAAIQNSAEGVPGVDQAQVDELQRAIQAGSYQVDPQQIALKIMQIELLLAGKAP